MQDKEFVRSSTRFVLVATPKAKSRKSKEQKRKSKLLLEK
jgi:hypothetical protein